MEVLQWLNVYSVIVGAILGAIIAVFVYIHFTLDDLGMATFVLINASFSGVLVSRIISYFLSVFGQFWGIVPAVLVSGCLFFFIATPMNREFGRELGLIVRLAAAVGAMAASWGHILMLGISASFFTYVTLKLIQ